MNKTSVLIVALTTLLVGCASTPQSPQQSIPLPPEGASSSSESTAIDWGHFTDKILNENNKSLGIEALYVHDGSFRIVIPSSLIHKNNELSSKAHPLLKEIINEMTHNLALRAKIVGHMAIHKNNLLNQSDSLQIAYSTASHLIRHNVRSNRISVEGRGSIDPLVSLESPKSKEINRRVEIYLYKLK